MKARVRWCLVAAAAALGGLPSTAGEDPLAGSVHEGFECTDCHEEPAAGRPGPVDCGLCHESVAEDYEQSVHGRARAAGAEDAPTCADCHGAHDIRAADDPASRVYPLNEPRTCARCHADPKLVRRHEIPVPDPLEAYRSSVHGVAVISERDFRAATCSRCHGGHLVLPMDDPRSTIFWRNIPDTCGACHRDIARDFRESVHGRAAEAGVRGVPVCIDCHGEHAVRSPRDPASPVHPLRVSRETCGRCHASELIARRYGLPLDRLQTFERSYHGLAVRAGSLTAANCASCHGIHRILPSSDPESKIHPANLRRTCGACHDEGAAGFARGPVHVASSTLPGRIVNAVRRLYIGIIVLVVSALTLHNGADLVRRSASRRRGEEPWPF